MKTAEKCREKKLCVASIVIILCDRCAFLKIKLYAFWNQCCTRGRESVAEGVFGGKPNVISVMPPGKQNCPLPDLARGSVVHPAGIEPTTFGVGGRHSIQLRYGCVMFGGRPASAAVLLILRFFVFVFEKVQKFFVALFIRFRLFFGLFCNFYL